MRRDPVGGPLARALELPGELWSGLGSFADRAFDRHLRLAVTGLSQSGKTVFITALVHHLQDGAELPFLEAVHSGRYLGARILPPRPGDPQPFPYEELHQALTAAEPRWPRRTQGLSLLRLDVRFRPRSLLMRQIAPIQRLKLEIIDYPGEWLLDLPLLELDYSTWSRQVLEACGQAPRAALAREWLAAIHATDLDAPADEAQIAELARLYTAFLERCRDAGLSLVQPGRFTQPGAHKGSELLRFCPLPDGPESGLRAAMAERYRQYRKRIVEPFYREHFSRFDRQIVLVDLLAALNRGPEVFEDAKRALEAVLRSFRYGASSWLFRLFSPRIDKVVFAATKADHVASNQHVNFRHLLERMIQEAARGPRFEGVPVEALAIASLRCTDSVRTEHQGQVLSCVRGHLRDENRETVLFPGEIPPDLPEPEDWDSGRFRFRDFAPRRLWSYGAREPQHIRLDQVLEALIGDRLL